jgi:hypothetical protein
MINTYIAPEFRGRVNEGDDNCIAQGSPLALVRVRDPIGHVMDSSSFGLDGYCANEVTPELLALSHVQTLPEGTGQLAWFPTVKFVQGDIVNCNVQGMTTLSQDWGCTVTHRDGSFHAYVFTQADYDDHLGPKAPVVFNANGTPITTVGQQGSSDDYATAYNDAARARGENIDCSANPRTWPTCLGQGIAYLLLQFCSYLLGLAGSLFNWVMVKAVFGFSTLVGNSPGLLAAWGVIRDIGNMLLLFGFIFIGLAMILDLHTYAAKKTLPKLIIFAVLMNFSLFAAEAVIDVSNGLSTAFYNQGTTPCVPENNDASGGIRTEDCAVNQGLAAHMMQSTGISSVFSPDASLSTFGISGLLALSAFSLIATFVLLSASIMLIIRAVVLTFLMVLAPLGFAAMAVPALDKVGKEWWNKLIHQAFYAPILILLILVSLTITDGLTGTPGLNGSLAASLSNPTPNSGVMGVVMAFTLVCGFLLASIIAAKKFGAMGADFAVKAAGGLTYGTVGFAGRRTVGATSLKLGSALGKTKFGRSTALGNMMIDGLNKGATSSFDIRQTKLGALSKSAGLDLGKPGKAAAGGFAGEVKAKAERDEERAKAFSLSKQEQRDLDLAEGTAKAEKEAQAERDRKTKDEVISERTKLEAELQPRRDALKEKKKEIDEARKAGNEALAKSLEEQLANDLRLFEIVENEGKDRIKDIEDRAAKRRGESEKAVAALEKAAKSIKEKPKTQYAGGLDKRAGWIPFTVSEVAAQKTAKKIRDDLKKTKTELALDRLEHSVKEAGEHAHEDFEHVEEAVHEESHAPSGGGAGSSHGSHP